MPQSLAQVYLHTVFSTKKRRPFLTDGEIRRHLHAYLAGVCYKLGCTAVIVGGVADHVHLLTRHSRNITIAQFVRQLKRGSSKWIKKEYPSLVEFRWQNGYGVFSVSSSHLKRVERYIANQERHHGQKSYKEEFRHICREQKIDIDERYVWD